MSRSFHITSLLTNLTQLQVYIVEVTVLVNLYMSYANVGATVV